MNHAMPARTNTTAPPSNNKHTNRLRVASVPFVPGAKLLVQLPTNPAVDESKKERIDDEKKAEDPLELDVYNQGMSKTELCDKWQETGVCPYGHRFHFRHAFGSIFYSTTTPRGGGSGPLFGFPTGQLSFSASLKRSSLGFPRDVSFLGLSAEEPPILDPLVQPPRKKELFFYCLPQCDKRLVAVVDTSPHPSIEGAHIIIDRVPGTIQQIGLGEDPRWQFLICSTCRRFLGMTLLGRQELAEWVVFEGLVHRAEAMLP